MLPLRPLLVVLIAGCSVIVGIGAPTNTLARLTGMLAETDDSQLQADVLRGMNAALKGTRSLPMPAGWDVVELKLGGSTNRAVRLLTESLSLTFGSPRALDSVRTRALDHAALPAERRAALESLAMVRDAQLPALLQRLVGDPAVRAQVLRGLAGFDDSNTPGAILAVYSSLEPGERREALAALASRTSFARSLVTAVGEGRVPKADLTADLVRQLRQLGDPTITHQLTQLWGLMQEASPDMQKEIEKYKRLYREGGSQPGDGPRGRLVYDRVCAPCHRLFDKGGEVGPDITGANRANLDYLLETILFPNAVIPNEYRATTLETKDGRVVTGLVKAPDGNSVTIQTQTESLTVPRREIARLETGELSMMPEGLLSNLSPQEVRDLLYYLGRPGQVPLPGNGP